ncbi:hypothetical protein J2X29_002167 [Shewanella putrefaciens]|nr:hypothetical protein [Shewanella putrefaciens]
MSTPIITMAAIVAIVLSDAQFFAVGCTNGIK